MHALVMISSMRARVLAQKSEEATASLIASYIYASGHAVVVQWNPA